MEHIAQNDQIVDQIDQHDELKPKLLAIAPPVAMNGHDVCVPNIKPNKIKIKSNQIRYRHDFLFLTWLSKIRNQVSSLYLA